jgi:hypothetical protein
MLYFVLVSSKVEYTFVAWNSVTITDSNKNVYKKICSPLPQQIFPRCGIPLWHYIGNTYFVHTSIHVFTSTEYCPSVLETAGIRIPNLSITNFIMFGCSFNHCPSARRVSAGTTVCKSTDICRNSRLNLKYLKSSISYILILFCHVLSYCCCLYSAAFEIGHCLLSSARK